MGVEPTTTTMATLRSTTELHPRHHKNTTASPVFCQYLPRGRERGQGKGVKSTLDATVSLLLPSSQQSPLNLLDMVKVVVSHALQHPANCALSEIDFTCAFLQGRLVSLGEER